MTILLQRE